MTMDYGTDPADTEDQMDELLAELDATDLTGGDTSGISPELAAMLGLDQADNVPADQLAAIVSPELIQPPPIEPPPTGPTPDQPPTPAGTSIADLLARKDALRSSGRTGYNEARYQAHRAQARAEAEATYQAHRAQALANTLNPTQRAVLESQRQRYRAGLVTEEDAVAAMLKTGLPEPLARAIVQGETAIELRRKQLIEERRLAQKRLTQEAQLRTATLREPRPLAAPPAQRAPSVSWNEIVGILPQGDLDGLIGGWQSGSSGIDAITPARLWRLMAMFPIANSAPEFLGKLRSLWMRGGGAVSQRTPAPRFGTSPSLPRPVRFRQPQTPQTRQLSYTSPSEQAILTSPPEIIPEEQAVAG